MNIKNPYISFLAIIFACFLSGCSEQEPKPDKEKLQVQLGIDKLKQACSQSLKIVDIIPTFYSDRSQYNAGWFFSFSDGTEIEVLDQTVIESAVSQRLPFIKTDLEGNWIFSYPEGESDYILDKEGKKMNVFNNSGTGLNINDDLQISLVADDSGTCFLELSGSSGPTSSQYIETPYISDDSGEILMVISDDFSGRASIFLSDGERYDFNILKNMPETITPLVSDKIAFKKKGEEIKFDIIINPSNIFINHEISSEECQISLRISYINEDENAVLPFELANVVVSQGPDNKIIPGRYTITLKDSGNSRFVYEEEVSLNLWFYDENGERIFISSKPFTVGFAGYDYPAQNEEFPILFINTPEPIISKYDWVKDCEIEIYSSPTNSIQIKDVNMKGRGSSTWVVPKKPLAIKLDKKTELFGFPKHKRWVLLANYYDLSNIRTELAFYMSRLSEEMPETGLEYTPRSKFVRVVLNDKYQGLYLFTEQLKIDENRVNVGDDGFLLEIDGRAGADPDDVFFSIPHIYQPIVIKDPDVVEGDENYEYVVNFMKAVGSALYSQNYLDEKEGYKNLLDLNSFVDWYIVNELTKNSDSTFNTSCYMNFERGGKLKMGPVWDFDLAMGNFPPLFSNEDHVKKVNNPEGFFLKGYTWFSRMFSDPAALAVLKERYTFYYQHRNDIFNLIDELKVSINPMIYENDVIWHFFSNPFDELKTYEAFEQECEDLKEWLSIRYDWLYNEILKL